MGAVTSDAVAAIAAGTIRAMTISTRVILFIVPLTKVSSACGKTPRASHPISGMSMGEIDTESRWKFLENQEAKRKRRIASHLYDLCEIKSPGSHPGLEITSWHTAHQARSL